MPQTANEALRDALIRHEIYLLRYSSFVRNQLFEVLDKTEQDVADKIRSILRTSQGLRTPADVQKLNKLMQTIRDIRGEAWTSVGNDLQDQMTQLAVSEPVFMQGIFTSLAPVELDVAMPADRQLIAIATARPFEGRILSDWADTMQGDDLRRIQAAIQMGMVSGDSPDEIVRRVMGSIRTGGSDGMTEITRRQIQAIVRTAVQFTANASRDEFFAENSDILDVEVFVATLDSRTTAICRALDGKRFLVGEGPRPPLHFNCRSIRVAAFDDQVLGSRPAKPATQKMLLDEYAQENDLEGVATRDDLPYGSKGDYDAWANKRLGELIGQVPASTTYQEWLSGQSTAFQNEVLGVAKGQLFRDGGLKLDQYVTPNGSELTLAQLASKYPDAFSKAGLDINDYIH